MVLQTTVIGNGDTIQNSKIYNLATAGADQSLVLPSGDFAVAGLQNTTMGNMDTVQNSTVYNLQGPMPTNTYIAPDASCADCTVYPGTYSTLQLI